MFKTLLSAAFLTGAALSFGQSSIANGTTVDDFTVTDTDGNTYSLYDITASGKYVYLDFFFDTCPPCQSTTPIFNEAHDKYGCNDGDLFFISINNGTDSDAEVEAFEASYGGTFHHAPAVSSEGGSTAVDTYYGISAYPTYVLIGPDNKMIANDIWPLNSVADLEAALPSGANPQEQACTFAGTEETSIELLSVYPNPTQAQLTLNFSAKTSSTAEVAIYNMMGQEVLTSSFETTTGLNQSQLDVADLSNGQYIAQITLDNETSQVKFNVQK
ncbi:MAG: T9SS type A sorting domain-containing protein [Crocinitomicaceae bacterium]